LTPAGARRQSRRTLCRRADREDDHLQSLELQPALDRRRRLVVELARQEVLLLEDQLPGEERGAAEASRDLLAELLELLGGVGAERVPVLAVAAVLADEVDVALQHGLGRRLQVLDLVDALEPVRVDDADRDEDEVLEVVAEELRDRQHAVET